MTQRTRPLRNALFAVLLPLLLLLAACSSVPSKTRATSLPAPDASTMSKEFASGADYRIGAQDLLDVTVFGVKELDREVRVNANGQISLPLIGVVQAGGHTIPGLEHLIEQELGKTYLQNPQVSVFVKEYASQRITVNGSVNKPGIYPITGRTTLVQAIAEAGGMAPLAEQNSVVVFRTVDGKRMMAVFNMNQITDGRRPDPEVYGNDLVMVPESGSKGTLQNLIKSAPFLYLFFLL